MTILFLDPAEHDMWAIHDLDEWQRLMGEVPFRDPHTLHTTLNAAEIPCATADRG
ncbi:hypothetical protein [Streptomyces sp. SD15]